MYSLGTQEEAVSLSKVPVVPGDQQPAIQPPSFNYLAGGCHFMYLPNRPTTNSTNHSRQGLSSSASLIVSSSAEKVNNGPSSVVSAPLRESLQDSEPMMPVRDRMGHEAGGRDADDETDGVDQRTVWNVPLRVGGRKGRRFTFQSTVRQIERRKIADKLSREAEEREAQRLSELEAMQKVEQEFQMKRAREKASIRQQLRLFSLEAQQHQSNQYDADYSPTSVNWREERKGWLGIIPGDYVGR